MKFINKLSLIATIINFIHYSSGNECEIAKSIYEELGDNIPECCDNKNIVCNKNGDKVIELYV